MMPQKYFNIPITGPDPVFGLPRRHYLALERAGKIRIVRLRKFPGTGPVMLVPMESMRAYIREEDLNTMTGTFPPVESEGLEPGDDPSPGPEQQAGALISEPQGSPRIDPNAVYLTDEAARLVRCKPCTIHRAIRLGRIKAMGRPFRILGSELLKFAAAEPSRYFR